MRIRGDRVDAKEIKRAIDEGLGVYWCTTECRVWKDEKSNGYFISSEATGHMIGLTWANSETLNGKEDEFFIKEIAN